MSEIIPYTEPMRHELIAVWEASVRATHNFLNPDDIDFYKTIFKKIDFNSFSVYCAFAGLKFIGFIGVSDGKIEML
ncbi:MAG: GNAT family N-acetyltransferase, partial [Chitinophagaceae bacterium]|nr:GNAT family N-acetyltransferase [Chitinophagaceae bacterium]